MLQVVLQAVSVLAVAGGVVYAALQFRGWRTAQYVANVTKLVELQLQLRKMVVDDPTLAPVGLALPAEDQGEATRGHFYNLMQLITGSPCARHRWHGAVPPHCRGSAGASCAKSCRRCRG